MKKRSAHISIACFAIAGFGLFLALALREPLEASSIEKVMDPSMSRSSLMMCQYFDMSLAQFNQRLNDATAIWEMNLHDYTWLPCYFKATIDGKEYRLRSGGLAEVWTLDGKLKKHMHWTEK